MIEQFVAQSNHRRELEKLVIRSDVKRANWGLVAGFILALVGLGGSFYVISLGYGFGGIGTLLLSLGTIVSSFLYAERRRRKEREEKEGLVPE